MLKVAKEVECDVAMAQLASWAMENRQILDRVRMAIFQTAIGQPLDRDLPATTDGSQGVVSGPVAFSQAVKSEWASRCGLDIGQLFDLKILRYLPEFHDPVGG
jgi:hypothetical protein